MLQISQRPLHGTTVDAELFVDRADELAKLRRSVRLGFNVLVLGDRGSGKTSLLRQFERQLVESESNPHFVESSGADNVNELVDLILATLQGRRRAPFEQLVASINGTDQTAARVARLAPANGEQTVVLLDSVTSPELVHHLFGRLRDEMWQLAITWVVSGDLSRRLGYLETPADSFFDAVIGLGELNLDDAAELLRRRALSAEKGDVLAEVLLGAATTLARRTTPRTPRNLLSAARQLLLANEDPTQWLTNHHSLQLRAAALGRPAAMVFTELMDLGPTSPSDKRLLDRLGWTRARAAQVLKQLENAGLVVATGEASGRPGRPRRLYSANSRFPADQQDPAHP